MTALAPIAEDTRIELTEKTRVYEFAHDKKVVLENVVELIIRPSGSHRVRTADGKLHIISTGWIAIHIDDDGKDWTA